MPTDASDPTVLLQAQGAIATITLNRPDKLNALDAATIDGLQRRLDAIEADDAIRAVILTGAGRAFSAGADIREMHGRLADGAERVMRDVVRRGQGLTRRIEAFPKPVIATVNGLAFGGGCEIVEACPLAVAAEHARFAKPEIRLGFPPPFGGSQRLPRLVGRKRALRMILTGDPIDAAEAQRIGLVNEVVPGAGLLKAALTLAERIIVYPPRSVAACLASVTRGLNLTIDEGLAVEAGHFERLLATGEIAAGTRAFLDRPRPLASQAETAAE